MMTLNNDRGTSLIEVLVVTVLLGVLAGIAISQYATYKANGVDAKVASAARQVATGQEAYYSNYLSYAADAEEIDGVVVDDVVIEVSAGNTGDLETSFRVEASHPDAEHSYIWVSDPAPGESHLSEV